MANRTLRLPQLIQKIHHNKYACINLSSTINRIPVFQSQITQSLPKYFSSKNCYYSKVCKRFYSDVIHPNCWNCNKTRTNSNGIDQFFCNHCKSITEIDLQHKLNYFNLLNLEEKFSINITELTKYFRELQSLLHPDKFSKKSLTEQNLSADWSSLINKAYKTLLTPIDRAVYMLELRNIQIPEDNTAVDKEFLFEIMERNEEIADAETIEQTTKLLKTIRNDIQNTIKELDGAMSENEMEKVVKIVIRMRYFLSMEKSIKTISSQLGSIV